MLESSTGDALCNLVTGLKEEEFFVSLILSLLGMALPPKSYLSATDTYSFVFVGEILKFYLELDG